MEPMIESNMVLRPESTRESRLEIEWKLSNESSEEPSMELREELSMKLSKPSSEENQVGN